MILSPNDQLSAPRPSIKGPVPSFRGRAPASFYGTPPRFQSLTSASQMGHALRQGILIMGTFLGAECALHSPCRPNFTFLPCRPERQLWVLNFHRTTGLFQAISGGNTLGLRGDRAPSGPNGVGWDRRPAQSPRSPIPFPTRRARPGGNHTAGSVPVNGGQLRFSWRQRGRIPAVRGSGAPKSHPTPPQRPEEAPSRPHPMALFGREVPRDTGGKKKTLVFSIPPPGTAGDQKFALRALRPFRPQHVFKNGTPPPPHRFVPIVVELLSARGRFFHPPGDPRSGSCQRVLRDPGQSLTPGNQWACFCVGPGRAYHVRGRVRARKVPPLGRRARLSQH